jgi:hypothetical protein
MAAVARQPELGNTVHETVQEVGAWMLVAVPTRVVARLTQPKVGAQVDDHRCYVQKATDPLARRPVGERQEKDVARLEVFDAAERQVGAFAQIGMDAGHTLARAAFGRDLPHLHLRMCQQQAQQLAAGVAGASCNGCGYSPQSSSSSGASASEGGSTLTTSSSTPHSGHSTTSPFSGAAIDTVPAHSGHSVSM